MIIDQHIQLIHQDIHLWYKHIQETGIEHFKTDDTMSPRMQAPFTRRQTLPKVRN